MIQLDSRLKRLILVLAAVAGMAIIAQGQTPASGIKINEENFPDENFRNYVLKQRDWVTKDSILDEFEITITHTINVDRKNIKVLTGIEYFTELKTLNCHNNQLTALDVSNNTKLTTLDCHSNQLTTLNVSNNALKTLDCSKNQLETLFYDNDALTSLNCSSNQFTALDVSQNTALSSLNCSNNKLSTLDVSNNTMLTTLDCSSNQLVTLNFSDNNILTSLNCSSNQLTALDVSQNTALSSLSCSSNQLTSLDVSKNTALTSLNCSSNQFTSLRDVSINAALTSLNCSNNKLTSLDVSENTTLKSLNCSSNQFTALDVSNYTALTSLNCSSNNKLSTLDVSKNTELTSLNCSSNNKLSTLDVSKNTELTNLNCAKSNLSKLDVSKNTKLSELRFNDCKKLIELIFSENNTELTNLYCYENNLKGDRMDSFVKALPKVVSGNLYVLNAHAISPHENNHIMKSHVDSVAKKGWKVFKQVDYTGRNWVEYAGSDEQPSYFLVKYGVDFNGGYFDISPWGECSPVGAEITIKVWPAHGYRLESINVYRYDDHSIYIEIPIVDNKTEFKFNMPAFDADVRVKFVEKQSSDDASSDDAGSDDAGNSTGLFNIRCENLSVFPNPTQGVLWVSVPELAEGTAAEMHVYNTSGQLLQRVPAHGASTGSAASRLSLDLSAYPAGVYIIRVGNAVAKVVKQ